MTHTDAGEMGFFRIEAGKNFLGVEQNFAWATPKTWMGKTTDCHNVYIDPSLDVAAIRARLWSKPYAKDDIISYSSSSVCREGH